MMLAIVDVSAWNGRCDASKVKGKSITFKGQQVPVVGAIVKCTEGDCGYYNPEYLPTIHSFYDNGFFVGSYHYYWAQYHGASQANFFKTAMWTAPDRNLWGWFDVEEMDDLTYYAANTSRVLDVLREDMLTFEKLSAHRPNVYSGKWYWDLLHPETCLRFGLDFRYKEWGANYNPVYQEMYGWIAPPFLWQYTNKISLPGINGNCDGSIFYRTMQDLIDFSNGLSLIPPPIAILHYWVTNWPGTYSRSMPSWNEGKNVTLYYYHDNLDVVLDNGTWCKLADGSWVARNRVAPRP